MRIFSKFKDYYDSARGLMYDKSLVFERYEDTFYSKYAKDVKYPTIPSILGFKRIDKKIIFYRIFIVGFCGKLYHGQRKTGESANR